MASIKRYKTARGTAWRVQYRSPDGKSRTKQGFRTKDQAQAWAEKNAVAVRNGEWVAPELGATTVAELAATWKKSWAHLKPATKSINESTWRVHVEPMWGHRQIKTIRQSEVQVWLGTIKKHTSGNGGEVTDVLASPTTVRNCHMVLAQILDLAVTDRMILSNPARGVKLPKKGPGVKVYLTPGQLQALVKECGGMGDLIALLGTSGLRYGEATALRVGDVDFLRRRVRVERNVRVTKDGPIYGTPKTGERRTVAITSWVVELLEKRTRGKGKDQLLWTAGDGGPLRPLGHTSFFAHAVKRCQEADSAFPAKLTPHGLRHVAAGLMVGSGASVKVVQRQLGHASAAMTLDRYSDLFDGDLDSVASRMDAVFAQCRGIVVGS
ncbi:tyrosine-type recombinase/integrase [Corynebacterium sanguinis]|uniref:Site-specific integrase n=1 Tax=Corynebacterium sanguinis TaxID=2594913 RepID=A0A6C1TZ70_9CORY|nr:site-specific integrase [Corynebacterium sanguinis]TVS29829.1 site-specific integrase [Corynebacterium sanguinis]